MSFSADVIVATVVVVAVVLSRSISVTLNSSSPGGFSVVMFVFDPSDVGGESRLSNADSRSSLQRRLRLSKTCGRCASASPIPRRRQNRKQDDSDGNGDGDKIDDDKKEDADDDDDEKLDAGFRRRLGVYQLVSRQRRRSGEKL